MARTRNRTCYAWLPCVHWLVLGACACNRRREERVAKLPIRRCKPSSWRRLLGRGACGQGQIAAADWRDARCRRTRRRPFRYYPAGTAQDGESRETPSQLARVQGEVRRRAADAGVLFVSGCGSNSTPAGGKTSGDAVRTRCTVKPRCWSQVSCHTDRLGNAADNESFTTAGRKSCARPLTAASMDAEHVMAVGPGDQFPIADNATADGRRLNRRVELSLIPITR